MIVQLTGLPGTGKTTLATSLSRHFGARCLLLNKDLVRDALYGPSRQVAYQREQDDFVVSLLHLAARERLTRDPKAVVVLERTGTRAYQLADVTQLATTLDQPLAVIDCWCPDHVARARLNADRRDGTHPAGNRTFNLYQQLQQSADPITIPALQLRTDTSAGDMLDGALGYLDQLDPTQSEAAAR
ncbi:AAA family ATPase [Salinispora arenicola]|uniref:AAA family ATPase n=1 Tax=Salinispora arenicola TaxID=168697 RepID=UPI00036115A7|nr:AAA family ATPase [Salinispora arenicola]